MELSRLMGGGTPLVMNINVQDAVAIVDGAVLSQATLNTTAQGVTPLVTRSSAANDAAFGISQVSSAQASASVDNVNAMNAYRFNIDTDGIPNRATTTGSDWLPVCVNPDALYYAEYSIKTTTATPTASDALVTGITAAVGTVVTIASTSDEGIAGGWLMDSRSGATSSAAADAPTFSGQLRFVANATGTIKFGLLTSMNVSVDSNLLWASPQTYSHTLITASASSLASQMNGSTDAKFDQGMKIMENYVKHSEAPLHPLRQWVDDGLDGLTGQSMYSELWVNKITGLV